MYETIAIAALVVAAVAILIAASLGKRVEAIEAALLEVGDDEEGAEEGAQELWLSDGEFYSADKVALEAKFPDAMGFVMCEGVPSAVTATGVWSLHKLLTDKPSVRSIK